MNERVIYETNNLRKLQLMLIQYRDLYSRSMLVNISVALMIMEILCIYNSIDSIKNGTVLGGLNIVYMWCAVALACNVISFFGTLASIHQTSLDIHQDLRSKREFGSSKWMKRWITSLPVLKVNLGDTNFLEVLTPLTMQDFVIDQTISLLLL